MRRHPEITPVKNLALAMAKIPSSYMAVPIVVTRDYDLDDVRDDTEEFILYGIPIGEDYNTEDIKLTTIGRKTYGCNTPHKLAIMWDDTEWRPWYFYFDVDSDEFECDVPTEEEMDAIMEVL